MLCVIDMIKRHRDNFIRTEAFNQPTLVVCPKCDGKAVISVEELKEYNCFSTRLLVCSNCAYRDQWQGISFSNMPSYKGKDSYFQLPYWLMVSCGKEFLFAYNEKHLDFLESYVSSTLRERIRDSELGWSNRSAVSRLPRWVKSKKNRAFVLKGIKKLRNK